MTDREQERATWGKTACHWIPPAERDAMVRNMIWSQRLSGLEFSFEEGMASLLKVLHEPMVEIG